MNRLRFPFSTIIKNVLVPITFIINLKMFILLLIKQNLNVDVSSVSKLIMLAKSIFLYTVVQLKSSSNSQKSLISFRKI